MLLIAGIIAFAILAWWNTKEQNEGFEITSYIFLTVFIIISCVIATDSIDGRNKCEVFYDTNYAIYGETVDMTTAYLSEEEFMDFAIDGSLEKLGLANAISERISEWRQAVVDYNESLKYLEYWNGNPAFSLLIANTPERLKYLEIR